MTNPVFGKTKTGYFICTSGLGDIFYVLNYSKFDPQKTVFWRIKYCWLAPFP